MIGLLQVKEQAVGILGRLAVGVLLGVSRLAIHMLLHGMPIA